MHEARRLLPALLLPLLLWVPVALFAAGPDPAVPPCGPPCPAPVSLLPAGARLSERLFGLPGLSNVGRLAPGVYRGAQPKPEGYATLRAMGVRTVINLRFRHSERKAVEAAGMRSVEIPLRTTVGPDPAQVRRIVALMRDPANQPVFVHCAQGQDRTGIAAAVFRMEVDGWSNAEAEAEMQAFGFNDIWRGLKDFVRNYRPPASRDGKCRTASGVK